MSGESEDPPRGSEADPRTTDIEDDVEFARGGPVQRVEWVALVDEPRRLRLIGYANGEVGFSHRCNLGGRAGPDFTALIAPLLQLDGGGHSITLDAGVPTVTPSILCPDCGLHGFVTEGVWRDA